LGLAGAGVAAASFLSGCTSKEPISAGQTPDGVPYEVYDADVLIVGTGNSGMAAGWQALKEGRSVTYIDKAEYRRSGCSGWSWGCYSQQDIPQEVDPKLTEWLVNMPLWKNAMDFFNKNYDPSTQDARSYQINHGHTLVMREQDGSVSPLSPAAKTWYGNQFFRREEDKMVAQQHTTIYENTMITNLLIQDGNCIGAIGVHIPTGTYRVFRANATINCAGSAQWVYGWFNTKPVSLGGADHTGDMMGICYRNGLTLAEMEFAKYDFCTVALRATFGCILGADYVEAGNFVDVNGDPVFPDPSKVTSASILAQGIANCVHSGKGSPNGGVYIQFKEAREGANNYMWEKADEYFKNELGIDPLADKIEVLPEQFERFGGVLSDENMMSKELPGFFDVRAAGGLSIRPVPAISALLKIYGVYIGHTAAAYAAKVSEPSKLDNSIIATEINRLEEIRTRDVSGALRPSDIRENIQKRFYSNVSLIRDTDGLNDYLTELERIRTEDMPKMCITDHAANWNKEWKEAIENYNLLDVAEMAVQATLFREESRYQYIRPDFPNEDPAWQCYTAIQNVNGKMQLSKQDIPQL
jgi:succinate dehydrogenase / fumarate reductase flavoprotein subunit